MEVVNGAKYSLNGRNKGKTSLWWTKWFSSCNGNNWASSLSTGIILRNQSKPLKVSQPSSPAHIPPSSLIGLLFPVNPTQVTVCSDNGTVGAGNVDKTWQTVQPLHLGRKTKLFFSSALVKCVSLQFPFSSYERFCYFNLAVLWTRHKGRR